MIKSHTAQTANEAQTAPLPHYRSILLAADSSDHANQASRDAARIAGLWDATVCGAHVYAARLHDLRFRQMEGGLPEQFRQEQELERQRDVHDDLITRGLSIITDSYLDQIERLCESQQLTFRRRSLEGKNYRELTREANGGDHDLLIMGAQGLGAVKGSQLGTVCERVSRRTQIDTLVIKNPRQSISEGPLLVAIDGSDYAYGALLRGISLAKAWDIPLHVISAFDPYYHYVAFNRIADVLSEEAGKIFRFKEQEQLHEEIIDSGLAKIYDGHLSVARDIAHEHNFEITTELLDGKPWEAILKYRNKVKASLLILGKTGIHADPELDIGGNSENLLRMADCAVLLTTYAHQPRLESIAEASTSWTHEAQARMQNVPSFVQNMARSAILRYAQEHGHTVITESIVEEATRQLMPGHAEKAMQEIVTAYDAGEIKRQVAAQPMQWSEAARTHLGQIDDESLRDNLALRAEKKARGDDSFTVELEHVSAFVDVGPTELHWQAAALARLSRVPEGFMRDTARQRIEEFAHAHGRTEIDLATVESGLELSRQAMQQMTQDSSPPQHLAENKKPSICPFARAMDRKQRDASSNTKPDRLGPIPGEFTWGDEAEQKIASVPPGFCRDMTRKAAESIAAKNGQSLIDGAFVQQILDTFAQGSDESIETLAWDEEARQRIAKAPDMVRGMLIREIEGWVKRRGDLRVSPQAVDAAKQRWQEQRLFHLASDDPRNRSTRG